MSPPQIKNEISVGTIATLIGLVATVLGFGVAIGTAQQDISQLKLTQTQSIQDSRALIKIQADMDYLKSAIDDLRARP